MRFAWWLAVMALGCGDTIVDGTQSSAGAGAGGASNGPAGSTSSSSGSGGACAGECMSGFLCCNGACVNPLNDVLNCGGCGEICDTDIPYCDQGDCGEPPCNGLQRCSGDGYCCGTVCCNAGELCCDVPGPVGSTLECFEPNENGTCPTGCTDCKCTSPDTPIATPLGERAIASLREGDLVYSLHEGRVAVVPLIATHRVPAHDHVVRRLVLDNGAVLEVSSPHPTADGRTFATLAAGDSLDGVRIAAASTVPYRHAYTYDILPGSDSGSYFAGGALIASTLRPPQSCW